MNDKPLYTLIPNKALDALVTKDHKVSDIVVYLALCRYYNAEKNQCWPSLNTIAKVVGASSKNIGRSLKALCYSGMIVRERTRSNQGDYDRNVYFLPHLVSHQIENLLIEKSTPKNKKRIEELRSLELLLLKAVEEFRGTLNLKVPTFKKKVPTTKKSLGTLKNEHGVPSGSPTNNTTINTTINITKNVSKQDDQNNVELTSGLGMLKRLDRKMEKSFPTDLRNIGSLKEIQKEGLARQLADELDDDKSLPYFRNIVNAFAAQEGIIFKCLSLTKETQEITGIKKSKGAVFTDHIKREAEQLGIKL